MRRVALTLGLIGAFAAGGIARPYVADLWAPSFADTASPRASQQEGLTAPVNLVMFGDSLTDHGRWDELLGLKVANRGVGGDTVAMAAKRVHTLPPGPVFVMLGINDLQRGRSAADVVDDYVELLESLKGREVVVQSVVGPDRLPVAELNADLRKIAELWGARYLDLTPALGHPLRYTYDGIHLTGEGYRLWAAEISRSLL